MTATYRLDIFAHLTPVWSKMLETNSDLAASSSTTLLFISERAR